MLGDPRPFYCRWALVRPLRCPRCNCATAYSSTVTHLTCGTSIHVSAAPIIRLYGECRTPLDTHPALHVEGC